MTFFQVLIFEFHGSVYLFSLTLQKVCFVRVKQTDQRQHHYNLKYGNILNICIIDIFLTIPFLLNF